MPIFNWSPEDETLLREMLNNYRESRQNESHEQSAKLDQRSNVVNYYIALPTAEIPGLTMTGTGFGEGDTPGEGTADIYKLTATKGLQLVKANQTVYNFDEDPVPVEWVAVSKDPWKWYVNRGGGGTSGTAGTSTACNCFDGTGTGTCASGLVNSSGEYVSWSDLGIFSEKPDYLVGLKNGCFGLAPVYECPTGTGV